MTLLVEKPKNVFKKTTLAHANPFHSSHYKSVSRAFNMLFLLIALSDSNFLYNATTVLKEYK